MAGNDRDGPNRQPRHYKRYLMDEEADIPRRTQWRRTQEEQNELHPDAEAEAHEVDEEEPRADDDGEENDEEEMPFFMREDVLPQNVAELQQLNGGDGESDVDLEHHLEESDGDPEQYTDEESDGDLEQHLHEEVLFDNPDETVHNLNVPNGNQPVSSEGSDMKKMDSLLAVLSFVVKHHLSGVALQDLIELINLHCPNTLPSSKYLFGNALTDYKGLCQFHFYCQCKNYIGCDDGIDVCNQCGREFDRSESMKKGQFFIVLPLTQQLQHLLQSTEVGEAVLNRNLKLDATDQDDITDITDGACYREMKRDGALSSPDNFSLLWNTDGVPIFKSSQCSMWPVLTMINELPMKMRRQNILLTALWFGETKPDMSVFLKPFIEECQKLSSVGLQWNMGHEQKVSKVYTLVCSVDTVARPLLQSMTQFNGFFGCGFCKHRGEYYERAMRYPYIDPPPQKRSDRETMRTSILAEESGRVVEGIKGVSILSFLMYFNIISSFIPDYMHSVCLGVVKRFMSTWLDSKNRHKEWFIGRSRQEIDMRLKGTKVTKEISRLPRSLKDMKFWKANEWRTFLYISPVILYGILPATYLAHWSLLVCAIHNLNQTRISQQKLQQSEFYLQKFVMFTDALYGKQEATFNNHLLLHLVDSVRNWGPLWGTSAFAFESFNGYIKKLFAGTRYLPEQIFKSLCHIQDLTRNLPSMTSHEAISYVTKMLADNHCVKNARRIVDDVHNIVCLGNGKILILTEQYKLAIQDFLGEIVLIDSVRCFDKFVYKNSLFTSKSYSSKFRRINSIVSLGNITCEILYLITFKNHNCQDEVQCLCNEHVILLVETLPLHRRLTCKEGAELGCTIHFISEVSRGQCKAYSYKDISKKGMFLKVGDLQYVISLPNLLESD